MVSTRRRSTLRCQQCQRLDKKEGVQAGVRCRHNVQQHYDVDGVGNINKKKGYDVTISIRLRSTL